MKRTLLNILCGILVAALLIAAVCIGAVRGWGQERANTLRVLTVGELAPSLEERAMDAANLAVVVARHLDPSDERLTRLQELRALLSSQQNADQLVQAIAELSTLADSLAEELPQLASMQASARDQAYLSTLSRTLGESAEFSEAYAIIVRNFNNKLINSPTGWIARLLGVQTIELPEGGFSQ